MSQVGFQLRLQRELFDPCGEQLLALVRCLIVSSSSSSGASGVPAAGDKKAKIVYLTLCNSPSQSQQDIFHITLHELKSSGASSAVSLEELPKKKRSWNLRQVKALDGKYDAEAASKGAPNLEFSLAFSTEERSNAPNQYVFVLHDVDVL